MRSINKVILIGNLTRDPELRQTPQGQSVCTFSIATNRDWITQDKRRMSSAEFHECVAWAHLAETCANLLKKGKLIYVEGYLKTRTWDGTDGTKRFRTEITVQDMILLEKRPRDEFGGEGQENDFASENSEDSRETFSGESDEQTGGDRPYVRKDPTSQGQSLSRPELTQSKTVDVLPPAPSPAHISVDTDLGLGK